jgi:protocatechuate 3,4-dioxygenase alpha subunit
VFARGLLHRLVTRLYFPDEDVANDADPVLQSINDPGRRSTLIAQAEPADPGDPGDPGGPGTVLRFDIRLQGDGETVFFDV